MTSGGTEKGGPPLAGGTRPAAGIASPPAGAATAPNVGVAIPAAGCGRRMGGINKQLLQLRGEPVLLWSIRPFLSLPEVTCIAIALSAELVDDPPSWLTEADRRIRITSGGETRRDSVWRAIQVLPDDVTVVAVHDAARPLVDEDTVRRCLAVAQRGVGAVAGVRAIDTLKRVDAEDRIVETPDRSEYWHAQTPQVFPRHMVVEAYRRAEAEQWQASDDAALVERNGGTIQMVEASSRNLKLTSPGDLAVAEALLGASLGADR